MCQTKAQGGQRCYKDTCQTYLNSIKQGNVEKVKDNGRGLILTPNSIQNFNEQGTILVSENKNTIITSKTNISMLEALEANIAKMETYNTPLELKSKTNMELLDELNPDNTITTTGVGYGTLSKRKGIAGLADNLQVDLREIVNAFPDEEFNGRLNKEMAEQILLTKLSQENIDKLTGLGQIGYNKDRRSPAEYCVDIVYGWASEDIVKNYLTKNGFNIELTGADNNREFLTANKISAYPDIKVSLPHGESKLYDIYVDNTGYWSKTNRLDIKDNKWNKLSKNNAGMICVSKEGLTVIDIDDKNKYDIETNQRFGGKPCIVVKGMRDKLQNGEDFLEELYLRHS